MRKLSFNRFFSRLFSAVVAAALVTALAGPAAHAGKGEQKAKHKHEHKHETPEVDMTFGKAIFTDKERSIVQDYARSNKGGLPPGLAKRKTLPPGLQKQLSKNNKLPPGLEKRALPRDLASQLPAYSGPFERAIVGNDLVLLDPKTNVVLDVMQGVFGVPVDETLGKVGKRRKKD